MPPSLPRISPWWLHGFRMSGFFLFRRRFEALLLHQPPTWTCPNGPLLIYANHPNWWDPIVAHALAQHLFPERSHYFPIDAHAMARYPGFNRMGFIPVNRQSVASKRDFLRTAELILSDPKAVLWLTPQAQLTDARVRPVRFARGFDLLARMAPQLLPIAIDYRFADAAKPYAWVRLGEFHSPLPSQDAEVNLTHLLDHLEEQIQLRNLDSFSAFLP